MAQKTAVYTQDQVARYLLTPVTEDATPEDIRAEITASAAAPSVMTDDAMQVDSEPASSSREQTEWVMPPREVNAIHTGIGAAEQITGSA